MNIKLSVKCAGIAAFIALQVALPVQAETLPPAAIAALTPPTFDKGKVITGGSQLGPIQITKVAQGLANPWSIAFLPDGDFLITERVGTLRRVSPAGVVSEPISGVPSVFVGGHGGLLDVALSPDFKRNQTIYLSYSESTDGKDPVGLAVATGKLVGGALKDVKVIYRQTPKQALSPYWEFGSRFLFDGKGHVFITHGDNRVNNAPQELDKLAGKIVRLNLDGSVPADNPFVGQKGARPEIWSLGHRNVQGIGFNPLTGDIWATEHGPRGGDELNLIQPGKNYGWPIISYGIDYSGNQTPETIGTHNEGLEQPIYYWARSPGTSGFAFVTADSPWKGNLLLGSLADRQLLRLVIDGNKVVHEERLLSQVGQRIRDVRQGPDGNIYVVTDSPDGGLFRVTPPQAK